MFSFFKKKIKEETNLSGLQCDMHSHLLPGIDDGAATLDNSMGLIKGLSELGYSKLITTPHVYWDIYKNTPDTVKAPFTLVEEAIKQEKIPVTIHVGAEYYLDDHVDDLLQNKEPLLTLHKNYMLFEFSFVNKPMSWQDKIFNLQMSDYQPVLAHPERYSYFRSNMKIFEEIRSTGCLLQVNLLSLTGYYGKTAQEIATYLVDHNMVSFLGTDMHHDRHLETLRGGGPVIMPVVKKLLDAGALLNPEFTG
ncbi:tyrosine-protein phosphatase [Pinibacter aurantiacus]|uniref:protein-tyrosine-phosphatase n=1 Tax=Pinibacter aurantiacus TaxID=2851599 RepID=A0A9E2SAS2_9BACT|nr:CpsB/CapC family capsule biosynthesis tyrosine phosphatase [Pinibacter aurantiacus]MBV4357862.1 histidinol phosphatase [Pinibacter aurantiacus]